MLTCRAIFWLRTRGHAESISHYSWFLQLSIIEFPYRFLKIIVGNSLERGLFAARFLGLWIWLFCFHIASRMVTEVLARGIVSWVCTELPTVNRRSNVLGILLLWKLCISLAISSWNMSVYKAEIYHLQCICAHVIPNSINYTRTAGKFVVMLCNVCRLSQFRLWSKCIPRYFVEWTFDYLIKLLPICTVNGDLCV